MENQTINDIINFEINDKNLLQNKTYEFEKYENQKPTIYQVYDLGVNKNRLKAFLTEDEFYNKIPKCNQKFYKKI
jgi:hypothetical protein